MSSVLFRPLGVNASRRALRAHRKREVKELKQLVKFAEQYVGGRPRPRHPFVAVVRGDRRARWRPARPLPPPRPAGTTPCGRHG